MASDVTGRSLAVVTGAASGIGYNLAKCCAEAGYDPVLAADQPLDDAALDCRSRCRGGDAAGRPRNARGGRPARLGGHGSPRRRLYCQSPAMGWAKASFDEVRHVIDTNITGTLYLLHRLGRRMKPAIEPVNRIFPDPRPARRRH